METSTYENLKAKKPFTQFASATRTYIYFKIQVQVKGQADMSQFILIPTADFSFISIFAGKTWHP